MKRKNIFLTALVILFFAGISSAQKGYIKIGDIQGESLEKNHKDWIIIESFNQAIQKPIPKVTGRVGAAPVFTNAVFTKKLGRSTPKLMESCATGKRYGKVEMELTANNEDREIKTFYKVTLENVMISGISSTSICATACEVMEEVSLSFTKISWEHTDNKGQKVKTSYEIERER